MSEDNNKSEETGLGEPVESQLAQNVEKPADTEETKVEDVVAVVVDDDKENSKELSGDQKTGDQKTGDQKTDDQKTDRHDDRGRDSRGGGSRPERSRGEPSFEEKMRSFKKQSEERLLHIRRSREAKIGKKRTR